MSEPSPHLLADLARSAGEIAIDTEFMGEGRYMTQLCLVQVSAGAADSKEVGIVDPLEGAADAAPLAAVLADPGVRVVVHAGRQDIALLRRVWRTEVNNVFDTQVAAGFAGLRAQSGYEGLMRDVLGVRLAKGAGYTRWDSRPLTPEQLRYAREDVDQLLELAAELRRRLDAAGRLGWAEEECRSLEASSDARDPDDLFARLPRVNSLEPTARAVAHELVVWRERVAERIDRPASGLLNDTALIEVARRQPRDGRALEQIRGLGRALQHRHRDGLVDAVARGRAREPMPATRERHAPSVNDDAPLIALAEALIRARALEAGVAYELIASRADLTRIVVAVRTGDEAALDPGSTTVRTLAGWRRDLVGSELLALLGGDGTLRVTGGRVASTAQQ